MKKLRFRIRRLLCRFYIVLRKVKLPGFQGIGLYDVLRFFLGGLTDTKFSLMASAMAYQFFFSLLPTLLIVVIFFRQFPFEGLQEGVIEFILQFFPEGGLDRNELNKVVEEYVRNYLTDSPNLSLIVGSVLLALWGAIRGIIGMMKAFSKKEQLFKKRKIWELYGMALVVFIVLGGIITLGVGIRIGGGYLLSFMASRFEMVDSWVQFLRSLLEVVVTIITLFSAISALYYLTPATKQRWKFISPGSITAAVLTLAALVGLKYFFINFTNYDRLYGSLTAIIVLMVWFYYLSYVLLIGFELNAAIDIASSRKRHLEIPEEEEEILETVTLG